MRGAKPVHFDSFEKEEKPQNQKPEKKLPEKDFNKVPQKKSVFLLWLFSTITLSIYQGFWYLAKSREFYNLGTKKRLSKTLPTIFLVLVIIEILASIGFSFTITTDMGSFYQNLDSSQNLLIILIGLVYVISVLLLIILAFISRGIINEAIEEKGSYKKISWFFTLIFGFLYLQYEINRIINDKEEAPRKGPWIFLIIIILLIILSVLFSLVPLLGFI